MALSSSGQRHALNSSNSITMIGCRCDCASQDLAAFNRPYSASLKLSSASLCTGKLVSNSRTFNVQMSAKAGHAPRRYPKIDSIVMMIHILRKFQCFLEITVCFDFQKKIL